MHSSSLLTRLLDLYVGFHYSGWQNCASQIFKIRIYLYENSYLPIPLFYQLEMMVSLGLDVNPYKKNRIRITNPKTCRRKNYSNHKSKFFGVKKRFKSQIWILLLKKNLELKFFELRILPAKKLMIPTFWFFKITNPSREREREGSKNYNFERKK